MRSQAPPGTIGAIVSFIGAALLLILSGLGLGHLRRVPQTSEVFPKISRPAVTQTA